MNEPLLREHNARERAALDALAGELHASDPGAAPSPIDPAAATSGVQKLEDTEPAALNAKNRTSLEKTNSTHKKSEKSRGWQEIIEEQPIHNNKSEDMLGRQEIGQNLRQAKEEGEETDGALDAEKKPPLSSKDSTLDNNKSEHMLEHQEIVKNLRQAKEETDGALDAKKPPLNTNVSHHKILQKPASKAPVQGAVIRVDSVAEVEETFARIPAAKQVLETPTVKALSEQASAFAKSAAGTSMAAAADAFCRAAEDFAAGKGRKKRVAETEINKAAMALFSVAEGAPSSETALATIAVNLTQGAQMFLLSDTETKPGVLPGWWRWRRASSSSGSRTPSLKQRLRAAISARGPMLPIYADDEKQLVEKREVLYTLALATPVAILTAAAGLEVFHGGWALVAGASAGVWVLAASGMVMNQYAVFDLERLAARHLGRLGVLGAAVLFCFFTYWAFFPSTPWALWLLLVIAALALGSPWIVSCIRGDDEVISATIERAGDAAGRGGKLEMRRGEAASWRCGGETRQDDGRSELISSVAS